MTIRIANAVPEGAWDAAYWKVSRLVSWGTLFGVTPDAVRDGRLKLAFPHRIYWLSRYDIIRSTAPLRRSANERGWRFLVADGETVIASIQTWYQRGAWHVSSAQTGLASTDMAEALRVGDSDDVQDVEACYLWSRTNWTAALWLRPPTEGDGRVISLTRPKDPLTIMNGAEFLNQLREQKKLPVWAD